MLSMLFEEPTESGPSPRSWSVAALTDHGPREANEDRMFTSVLSDGAWVIAVADGLGGHPRGGEAAQAAVEGFPQRIGGEAEMAMTFTEANERVVALFGLRERSRRIPLRTIPMSTLCVAAWTPEGGLVIGWMGDTIPFVVKSGPGGFTGYCCGVPHRSPTGSISVCLGLPPDDGGYDAGLVEVDVVADFEDFKILDAVIIASDGAWEPLADAYGDNTEWLRDKSPAGIGSVCPPDTGDASDVARSVLTKAQSLGLNDNATVAVAHWKRPGGPMRIRI